MLLLYPEHSTDGNILLPMLKSSGCGSVADAHYGAGQSMLHMFVVLGDTLPSLPNVLHSSSAATPVHSQT